VARILIVCRASEGGTLEHLLGLVCGLVRADHEVVLCGPHERHRDRLGVAVVPLAMVRPISPYADVVAVGRLTRIIRNVRPDLIHAHGAKGAAIARVSRIASPRTPLVYTPHGFPFAGYHPTGRLGAYRLVERALSPLANRILCVCKAEAGDAALISSESRIRVVYNGVDPPAEIEPDPEIVELARRGPVVTAVTGLREGKGNETLVRAFGRVAQARPEATLVIAGDGPERASVEAEVAAAGLAGRVRLPGGIADVYALLAASDVFVLPSWAEAFPYSVLEAMALGMPILATDVGGVGEAIEDARSGLLVPPRDEAALARGLARLLDDREMATALGNAAQARQRETFTLSGMIEGTLSVYGELSVGA
jgi:glycosyltransferase involved in cell wall biosynthesis